MAIGILEVQPFHSWFPPVDTVLRFGVFFKKSSGGGRLTPRLEHEKIKKRCKRTEDHIGDEDE
jgi:hypothetical protein